MLLNLLTEDKRRTLSFQMTGTFGLVAHESTNTTPGPGSLVNWFLKVNGRDWTYQMLPNQMRIVLLSTYNCPSITSTLLLINAINVMALCALEVTSINILNNCENNSLCYKSEFVYTGCNRIQVSSFSREFLASKQEEKISFIISRIRLHFWDSGYPTWSTKLNCYNSIWN